jgi:AbrB family looped-hinge helix DNA binding protein
METGMIQIDKSGRVVLPKPLREKLNLEAGDKLRLSVEGNSIKLEPTDAGGKLARKGSVLVFVGEFAEPITTAMVENLLSEEREVGIPKTTGKPRKQ